MDFKYGYTSISGGNDKDSQYTKYAILQLLLVAAHYTSSIMIIYSNDNDKFVVPWKFQWNSWTPLNATGGTAACSKGCLIGEETYIFTGDERLNVSYIVAAFGLISGSNHLAQLLLYLLSEFVVFVSFDLVVLSTQFELQFFKLFNILLFISFSRELFVILHVFLSQS